MVRALFGTLVHTSTYRVFHTIFLVGFLANYYLIVILYRRKYMSLTGIDKRVFHLFDLLLQDHHISEVGE